MPSGIYERKPFTKEHIKNLGKSQKGHPNRNILGKGQFKKGHKVPIEWRKIVSNNMKGRVPLWKGKYHSAEHKEKNRLSHLGKKHNGMTKIKMSISHGGTGVSQVTSKRYYHIHDWKYKLWRSKVFERDNWTCQVCNKKSEKGIKIYLEPHHIKGWAKYPGLRYDINNGVTLCYKCHKLTRRKK